jgi:nucleoside-diphosphate-sugar epimerase
MKVIVTGSEGFLGHHLVAALAARGHRVLGLDRFRVDSPRSGETALCDILEGARLIEQFRRYEPEGLIHLAARTDLDGQSLDDYRANIQGVSNVVSAARQTPSLRRAIFTSSQLVCRLGYVPKNDGDYLPTTLYGQSKVCTERIVREEDGGGVTWCLVRPTTVWGPGMSVHYQRFLRMVARRRYVHIGTEPVWKTYGYVGNVVHQYLRLLESEPNRIYRKTLYLGDYEPLSLSRWADGLARGLGAPPIRSMPRALARTIARIGDALNAIGWKAFPFNSFRLDNVLTPSVFDLSETRAICGPLPYTVEEGIEETVRWFWGTAHLQPKDASERVVSS